MISGFLFNLVFIMLTAISSRIYFILMVNDVPGAWKFLAIPLVPVVFVVGANLFSLLLKDRAETFLKGLFTRALNRSTIDSKRAP